MKTVQIHPCDNVAVQTDGPHAGHKIALCDMDIGCPVIKYGNPIGVASQPIAAGQAVHTENLKTALSGTQKYEYSPSFSDLPRLPADTFPGYVRADGQVGIRNEIWIIPTVGCINGLAAKLAEAARGALWAETYAFPHPYGCSQLGDDLTHTRRLIASLAHNPNAGGVLLLGLGCENNVMSAQVAALGEYDPARIRFLSAQDVPDEKAAAMAILAELAALLAKDKREPVSTAALRIGLKCGGSDGFSGITANPLIGRITDRVIAQGGAAVLTEVPEMFGAEHLLMNRCRTRQVFDSLCQMINDFKNYFSAAGQPVYENPSPGNHAGGITTLEEKSLGCTQKSGSAPVDAVLEYGERVTKAGLSLLCAPGNDMVSSTALAAAGCQIILFSTGRGTPFGTCVPTVKIATNAALYEMKPGWIDFNAADGVSAEGTDDLWQLILRVAGGQSACNEKNGYRDIAVFKNGVTL